MPTYVIVLAYIGLFLLLGGIILKALSMFLRRGLTVERTLTLVESPRERWADGLRAWSLALFILSFFIMTACHELQIEWLVAKVGAAAAVILAVAALLL